MKTVFKYKKSLFIAIVLILVLVLALSFMGLGNRYVAVDMDNKDFCFNLEELAYSKNISAYPNVKCIATYNKELVLPVKLAINGERTILMKTEMFDSAMEYGYFVEPQEEYKKIEVYLISNILGEVPKAWIPVIAFVKGGETLEVTIERNEINAVIDNAHEKYVNIKLLIKIS